MLVKFLSFIASVLGTARYKAIFLSCLALVLAITGITAVTFFKGDGKTPTTVSSIDKPQSDTKSPSNTPQLNGISSQSAKTQTETDAQEPKDEQTSSSNSTSTSENKTKTTVPEIIVSSDKVSLAAGATSDTLTASLSNKSTATWSVTPVNNSDNGIKAILAQNSGAVVSFQLQANSDLQAGTVIHLNLTAQDSDHNTINKQITVTIQ